MTADLVERLRALARHDHSDVSVADEAADELEAASALRSSGEAVAWRLLQQVAGENFAWTRWQEMHELCHFGPDGNIVDGPGPEWKVEYAYLHPATVTDEDVERACVAAVGDLTEAEARKWPQYFGGITDADDLRGAVRAVLESFVRPTPPASTKGG